MLPSSDLLLMDTKTAAVSTVLIDHLEAIAYNIAATYNIAVTVQIQPSMSESADVSLPLPSLDLLLMDTKTATMSTVVIDDKTIEAIIHNITVMAQIQPSSMFEFADGADSHLDGGGAKSGCEAADPALLHVRVCGWRR
jgi:hypothetical protein